MRHNMRTGFTLIELIIVIVIIGVLASIAAPMMQGVKAKAICAEAVTFMGSIRSALRTYMATHTMGTYQNFLSKDPAFVSDLGLTLNGLNGTYFGKECYYVQYYPWSEESSAIFCAPKSVDWGNSNYGPPDVPKADEGKGVQDEWGGYLIMYISNGKVQQFGVPRSGLPPSEYE